MMSVVDALLFFPLLYCSLFARTTIACCSMLMSAGQFVAGVPYQGLKTVIQLLCDCYRVAAERCRAVAAYCSASLTHVCTAIRKPTKALATVLEHLSPLPPTIMTITCALMMPWCNIILTIITMPKTLTLHAFSSLAGLYEICCLWAIFLFDVPSCTRAFVLDTCTKLKEGARQLLWDMTPDLCKAVYAWLFTRPCGPSKQQSANIQVCCCELTARR